VVSANPVLQQRWAMTHVSTSTVRLPHLRRNILPCTHLVACHSINQHRVVKRAWRAASPHQLLSCTLSHFSHKHYSHSYSYNKLLVY
jgi:hypothetical protein